MTDRRKEHPDLRLRFHRISISIDADANPNNPLSFCQRMKMVTGYSFSVLTSTKSSKLADRETDTTATESNVKSTFCCESNGTFMTDFKMELHQPRLKFSPPVLLSNSSMNAARSSSSSASSFTLHSSLRLIASSTSPSLAESRA